jgi:hypothetical protein
MRAAILLLVMTASPVWADAFDGTWQGTNETGKHYRFAIHGNEVRQYAERSDGKFDGDHSCALKISRTGNDAFISFTECAVDGVQGPVSMVDVYWLTVSDANTLHVRLMSGGDDYPSSNDPSRDKGDWIRVEDRQ